MENLDLMLKQTATWILVTSHLLLSVGRGCVWQLEQVRLSDYEGSEERITVSLLTSEIAQSKSDIDHLLTRILDLDPAFARAAHAKWIGGACPVLISESFEDSTSSSLLVDIKGIWHPLLLKSSLRKPSNDGSTNPPVIFPVPADIKIGNNVTVVVISGPNTGGKTDSMKTLGGFYYVLACTGKKHFIK